MKPLIYHRQGTSGTTTNPTIAQRWYDQGEVVDNDRVINVWLKD